MNKIIFVTTNKGKIKEAGEILGIEIEPLNLEIDEVQTLDPIKCIEKKTEAAFTQAKRAILVEDTCLFFEAWNGLPGVFIDYFMKTMGIDGLIRLMKEESNRKAKAQTSLCYFDGKEKIITTGIVDGSIAMEKRGDNGFGWDPIFIPIGYEKTFAELGDEIKNKISMRRMALEKLREKLFAGFKFPTQFSDR
jgi:XTP/dITP diphosphohydrolase